MSPRGGVSPSPAALRCHNCGSSTMRSEPAYAGLSRVTSDCRPWPAGGVLATCLTCGLVQAPTTPAWREEADAIYRQYAIYHQAGGHEHTVFETEDGGGNARSDALVAALLDHAPLGAAGGLLDIGCGNGSFLRAFGRARDGWRLFGSEVNETQKASVEAIPRVERMFVCDSVDDVDGQFDLVSLIHVLEHLPAPLQVLQSVLQRLTPGGLLLIQVPDCAANPFMVTVADHCSHFTVPGLSRIVEASGFTVVHATNTWVPREITIVASKGPADGPPVSSGDGLVASDGVAASVEWLRDVAREARVLASAGHFGVFGTAIAATWLYQELGGEVSYFVDEDPSRVGRRHLTRDIIAPAQMADGSSLYIALPQPWADRVARRLERPFVTLAVPPERQPIAR